MHNRLIYSNIQIVCLASQKAKKNHRIRQIYTFCVAFLCFKRHHPDMLLVLLFSVQFALCRHFAHFKVNFGKLTHFIRFKIKMPPDCWFFGRCCFVGCIWLIYVHLLQLTLWMLILKQFYRVLRHTAAINLKVFRSHVCICILCTFEGRNSRKM